jgi:hypothetical protein
MIPNGMALILKINVGSMVLRRPSAGIRIKQLEMWQSMDTIACSTKDEPQSTQVPFNVYLKT